MTAASGCACAVPIVWKRGLGTGVVWFRAMYLSLGIQRPGYRWAHEQIKRFGARHCTAAERQLLLAVPGLQPSAHMLTLVASVSTACQWLRSVGEHQAAAELSQHQQPVPAAARDTAAQRRRTGLAAADGQAAFTAGVDLHQLLPADSNEWRVAPVARRTRAGVAVPAGLHLDAAALRTAGGAVCRVPILRLAGPAAGLVWTKALYTGLDMARPSWRVALLQLKQLGGRTCSLAERRLLQTFPGVSERETDAALVRVDAARQWLLRAGQPEAAAQLAHQDRQLAAAHRSAAGGLPTAPTPAAEQMAGAADGGDWALPLRHHARVSDKPAGPDTAPEAVRVFADLIAA